MAKHKRLTTIFYLLPIIFSVQANGPQSRFAFKYITNDNGLSHNTVYDICQDNKGFMWFSTESGLNRYDGQGIKQYRYLADEIHSIPSHTIPSLVYADNTLFVGTSSGLAVYCPETDNFDRILYKGEPIKNISSMRKGYGSELLITTVDMGAFIFDYKQKQISKLPSDDFFQGIIANGKDSYWVFSRDAVYLFDRNLKQTAAYRVSSSLFASAISHIWTDEKGRLWVGTFEKGIFILDPQKKEFRQLPICQTTKMYYIRTIEFGEHPNEYWVGTENGLYIINTETNKFEHYTQSFDSKDKTINDNAVYKVFRNKQGIFFLGTYFGGINIATRHIGFNAILPDNKPGGLHGKAISMIAKDLNDNLWMATEDAGIAILNRKNYTIHHLMFDEKDPSSISSNNVHTLLMDGNTCWAGHFMGGLSKIEIATGKAKRFSQNSADPYSISNNFVFSLGFFSPDSILVGTLSGVDLLDKKSGRFSRFRENEFADCFIYDIFTAPDGKIWFCTHNQGIFILDKTKTGLMTHFQVGDSSGLTSNSIISYCIDSKKQIWIGTRHGGLLKYRADQNRFEVCKPDMLIDDIIYGIVEDDEGFFWVSTNEGISRLNFKDSTSVHFNVKHGLAGNQHNYKSYFKDKDILFFGGVRGLTWFNPKMISTPKEIPMVYFKNLRIFNEIVYPDSTGVLEKQIDFTQHLNLKYNQNSFTIDFAAINYFGSDIAYQYYLEDFESDWSPATEMTQANYTNIAPGDYVFHIRAVNTITGAFSEERSLQITINPPFWASWYAYLLYFILLSGIAYYFYRTYKNRQREKMVLAIEKMEKENLKLLHQHKMNFFTYISHEFKTPLSIIISSVEMFSEKENSSDNEILQSIKRSASRLLFLVNQLMEFRKVETDHAVMQITKRNVVDFFNQVINAYRPLLKKKSIELGIEVSYSQDEIFFDFDKLEKIITNLLTNAIKYTPQNGTIHFTLKLESSRIHFSVKDSGGGISEKKKDKIFEVFYSDSFSNDVVESSGIGLALTASLVKLLKGEIFVESELGKGTQFNVTLPLEETLPDVLVSPTEDSDLKTSKEVISTITEENIVAKDTEEVDKKKEYTVVVAEDNKDLLMLINKSLKEKYHVKCFENGQNTWEYINKKMPDIVITDIMMPVMSGIELCQKIKTDVNLCHIPVIMLTAKDTKEAKLEGLQVGADVYITKPFLMKELHIRLTNLLNIHKAQKKRLKELAKFEDFDIPETNHEQAFVEKMLSIIQNNMENSNLDVQFIADTLNISRSNLHNKMKTLMNMSTSEFINTVRINRAKELMVQEEMTLSEIAYEVGYNDPAYFTRIFKKHTGKTPKEYQQELKTRNKM